MRAWEQNIRTVVPYVPGEQPQNADIIKLNTNENPYPPAPGVSRALETLDPDLLRRYPDPAAADLTAAIAGYYGMKTGQVFAGVGSDDVLAMAFLTCFCSTEPILFPDITYSFYDVWAELFRIPYEKQPLAKNFGFVRRITQRKTAELFFRIQMLRPVFINRFRKWKKSFPCIRMSLSL